MEALLATAVIAPWVLLAAAGWAGYRLLQQHGAQLVAIEELRGRILSLESKLRTGHGQPLPMAEPRTQPLGLPIGSAAPPFELPDINGGIRRSTDLTGAPYVLAFFSTSCGYCRQLAPRLGRLAPGSRVVLVSRGDAAEHRRLAAEHGWSCDVLLEEEWKVASAYRASGTPTGYLVDERGRIASELAVGADAVLALALHTIDDLTDASLREKTRVATERARAAGLAVRDLTESRVARNGLRPGVPAPNFVLPDLDGRPRALEEFFGRPTLVVFSDVNCGPCQSLAPDLARIGRRADIQVVMISRGEAEPNRIKAAEHGFTFPVLLQRAWEVSKEYALFGTPVAYLVDERGMIAKAPAVGAKAILQLV